MESLTRTLSVQHRAVEGMVAAIDQAVAARDNAQIRKLLGQLATALTAHLKLEDAKLYPELQQMAQSSGQSSLGNIGTSFSASMTSISSVLTRFLERYQKPDWTLEKFSAEWQSISSTLSTRIRTEETSLYPLYDRLVRSVDSKTGA